MVLKNKRWYPIPLMPLAWPFRMVKIKAVSEGQAGLDQRSGMNLRLAEPGIVLWKDDVPARRVGEISRGLRRDPGGAASWVGRERELVVGR